MLKRERRKILLSKKKYCEMKLEKFMNKKFDHLTKTNMKDKLESPETKLTYLVLPYINEDMEDFGRELSQLVKSFFKNIELRVVFKAPFEIKNFLVLSFNIRIGQLQKLLYHYSIGLLSKLFIKNFICPNVAQKLFLIK